MGGHDEATHVLLNAGARTTARAGDGLSPAHSAVKLGLDDSALALGISAAELGRRLRVAEMVCMEPHRQRRVVFAMGQHARLGAQSEVCRLEAGLVRTVLALAEAEAWAAVPVGPL